MGRSTVIEKVIRKETREQDGIKYCYTLLMSESCKVASYKLPLYSVKIEMTNTDGQTTTAHTRDLFADVGKAICFFKKLCANLATPINLPYILEDEMQ